MGWRNFDAELDAAMATWRYRPAPQLLDDRTILVTGASSGLGAAAALTFARYGAHVVLLGRTQPALEAVFDDIVASTHTDPTIVPYDLARTDEGAFVELAERIDERYGRLDGILHSAGALGPRVPLAHFAREDWDAVLRVNLSAPFELTHELLPLLQKAPDASVLFTSSSVGRRARAYWGAYAVSKFGIEGLSQVFADELTGVSPIRFNTVNPGATRTPMRAAAYPAEDPATVPTAASKMDIYLYLMGPDSVGVTGQQLDARDWSPVAT